MEQAKVLTYLKKKKIRYSFKGLKTGVSPREFFARGLGFFLAMAMPLPGMAPFGMAYLAQERKLSLGAIVSFLFAGLGSMVVCDGLGAAKYIGAGVIYLCALFVLEKGVRVSDVTAGLIAGGSVFATGFAVQIIEGLSLTGVFLLLCEVAALVSAALMMDKSIQVIGTRDFSPEKLDSDARLSLAAVILLAILSLKDVYLGSVFSVMNVTAAVLLLVVASGCGAGYSAGAGVVLGMVCGIGSDYFMPILGAFGFCGFLTGVFARFGKGGVIAGVILANGIMAVYTNSAMESVLSVFEVLAAAVVFALVPGSLVEAVRTVICLDEHDRESIARVKAGIHSRLASVAAAFENMSKTLEKLSDRNENSDNADIAVIFDMTADKICAKCRKSTVCWGRDFNSTYNEMLGLWSILRETGVVKPEDVREHFAAKCISLGRLLEELNHQFDIYRVRQVWRSKLCESRSLAGKQLGGMSKIIEGLGAELEAETGRSAISVWEMRNRFEVCGIKIRSLNVMQDRYGRNKAELVLKAGTYQGKQRRTIEKIMRAYLGNNIVSREEYPENKKLLRLTFSEAERYTVETRQASRAASEKNGDNFRMLHLRGGKFVIAISDGMGTGSRAARESEAILELLDSFLQAGFDSRIAVRLINSIMIMKSESEAFVTLDLCIIDLYTGEVKFIKTGAEPSFILNKGGRVKTVCAASLPVGLIAEAEAEVEKTKIQDGDSIVMITDGVENRENGSLWVSEFIKESFDEGADIPLAEGILSRAVEKNDGEVADDMTVLSIKLKAVS